MTRLRHEISTPSLTAGFGQPQAVHVTLPAPPWGSLDRDDRAATAPRQPTIRGNHNWRQDPTLRHADTRRDRG